MKKEEELLAPDAVFWDWDGTLADSYSFLNDAHNFTLETLGFNPFKEGEYRKYFGKPRELLYPTIYKEKSKEAKELFGRYVLENSHKIKTVNGSENVLEILHGRNIKMGIVSNKKSNFIARELKHLGWEHYFATIVGAGDAQEDKPSGAPLLQALENENVSRKTHNIWYIGDTENDLACAQNVGCHAVFLKGYENSSALIEHYKPLIIFDNYQQLREILVAI